MSDLKPCPFCRNEAHIVDDFITFYGQCHNCGATGAVSSYRSGAIEAWNRRAQPAQAGQVLTDAQVDAAAKKMAEIFDYPWDFMPEKGRATMRENVRFVIAAAHGIVGEKGAT